MSYHPSGYIIFILRNLKFYGGWVPGVKDRGLGTGGWGLLAGYKCRGQITQAPFKLHQIKITKYYEFKGRRPAPILTF